MGSKLSTCWRERCWDCSCNPSAKKPFSNGTNSRNDSSGDLSRRNPLVNHPIVSWGMADKIATTHPSIRDVLRIESIDLSFQENGKKLHTDLYELMTHPRLTKRPRQLVLRRGAPFSVRLFCDRRFDPTVDTMVLVFSVVPFGSETICFGNGTDVYVVLQTTEGDVEDDATDDWKAVLVNTGERPSGEMELTLRITTPSFAPVARWRLEFHCRFDPSDAKSLMKCPSLLYLLYNPWCKGDAVYMEDEDARVEYVLNDTTMIWKPTNDGYTKYSWNLGQFESNILDCTLYVMAEMAKVLPSFSGNPVHLTRSLAGALNNRAFHGVLEGCWTGIYDGGRDPASWSGSVKILQQFFATRQPVKYGQCWVYAGIFGTMCRSIGIPMRLVTNFQSGCDYDSSLTVDYFVDGKDAQGDDLTEEAVWNYHVFNEAWMKRPDLNTDLYDGWQVVDSTPQKLSDGMYKLGPCPVEAIKRGHVQVPYDTEFIFAEVNADIVYWSLGDDQNPPKPLEVDVSRVGKYLSTKAIGSDAREDVTDRYKFPEGSVEERKVMWAAMRRNCQRFSNSGLASKLLCDSSQELETSRNSPGVKLLLKSDSEVVFGTTIRIELIVANIAASGVAQEVVGKLVLKVTDYTGRYADTVKKLPFFLRLEPDESKSVVALLPFRAYHRPNTDQSYIKATCLADVKGTERTMFAIKNFPLVSPTIMMALVENKVGRLVVQIEFTNPLPVPLTRCRFMVEGSRYTEPLEAKYDLIPVGESVEFFYPINPSQRGKMVISARFVSNELKNVDGHIVVKMP